MRTRPGVGSILEVKVKVSMTDEDVVRRLHQMVPGSTVIDYANSQHPTYKRYWIFNLFNRQRVYHFLKLIRPWLGKRRRQKADEMIKAIEGCQYLNRYSDVCKNGHPRKDNTYLSPTTGAAQCRPCKVAATRRSRTQHGTAAA